MEQSIKFDVFGDVSELTVRKGDALPLKEPTIVTISGVLGSPYEWLTKRISTVDPLACNVIVDRERLSITLTVKETDHYKTTVHGKLQLHPMFSKFAINTERSLSNVDMAKLFKMNRSAFETMSVAMALVTELQNFRAKVDKEIEKINDNRGNKRDLLAQTVESNLPDSFNLCIPIFKGTAKETFPVEVYINPDDFSCTLISPVANDLIEDMRDSEIDRVLDQIRELAPSIVIIEQ